MSVKITAAAASVLAAGVLGIAGAGAAAAATTGSGSGSAQSTSSAQSGSQDGWKGHRHGTPVSGAALTQVTQAVDAKYPGVTVERAFKTPKGSYIVMGAKGSAHERFRVSADLTTVTERTGGHRAGAQ